MDIDEPTDVLAFDLRGDPSAPQDPAGEIAVAQRQRGRVVRGRIVAMADAHVKQDVIAGQHRRLRVGEVGALVHVTAIGAIDQHLARRRKPAAHRML